MGDFARISVRVEFSANSDYSNPKNNAQSAIMTATPDYVVEGELLVPNAGVIIYDHSVLGWSQVNGVLVQNLSTTHEVGTDMIKVFYSDVEDTAGIATVLGGNTLFLPRLGAADITLDSNGGEVEARYILMGTA